MDKNQFTGLILMFALLATYFIFFAPDSSPVEETESVPTHVQSVEHTTSESVNDVPDSVRTQIDSLKYGVFSFAASVDEAITRVENEELIVTFTNKGGRIKEVVLKNHKDHTGQPLTIMKENKSVTDLELSHAGKKINISELGFQPSVQPTEDTTFVSYVLSNGSFRLKQEYKIPSSGFRIVYNISSNGLNSILDPSDIRFLWNHKINKVETDIESSRVKSNVRYLTLSGAFDRLPERSTDFEEATIETPIKWLSFKQKFFTSAVIANTSFQSGYVTTAVDVADTTVVKNAGMELDIPYVEFINGFGYGYYFGPNNYSVLKKVTNDFEKNLDMGWGPLPVINKFLIIPIFHFLEGFLGNYGIIIIIIVIIIRLILAPLTYKSHLSMAKMRVLKPELDEIKEKHDGNMQKAQQEQMQLYQKVGINPLSGCIPIVLQMPILFSLFFFFPNAVELRQQSFLWATDLSTYDSIFHLPFTIPFYGNHVSLFTLLMTLSTLLTTWSNSQVSTVQGPMKTMQYVMPVMFLFVLNSYASGLTFYYFITNMLTFGQMALFRKFIDEKKIKQTLEENRKKNANKKKTKFQSRLEEAMKANREAQKNAKKNKK